MKVRAVFRAKLHKNMKYRERAEAEAWAAEAAQVIEDAERGAHSAEDSDGLSGCPARRSVRFPGVRACPVGRWTGLRLFECRKSNIAHAMSAFA